MNRTRVLHPFVYAAACLAMECLSASNALASVIPVGQTNDFQDGQLSNWQGGGAGQGFQSQNIISAGGPAGAGDQYALISAGGNNSGPRLLAVNDVQRLGDFSNIAAITLDLMSPASNAANGVNSLSMRLAIREGTANNSAGYVSTTAYNLPSDGNWYPVTFLFDAADMAAVSAGSPAHAPPAFDTLKTNVLDFRILDATNAVLVGDQFISTGPQISFGMDNITAVPEPGSLALAALSVRGLDVV